MQINNSNGTTDQHLCYEIGENCSSGPSAFFLACSTQCSITMVIVGALILGFSVSLSVCSLFSICHVFFLWSNIHILAVWREISVFTFSVCLSVSYISCFCIPESGTLKPVPVPYFICYSDCRYKVLKDQK